MTAKAPSKLKSKSTPQKAKTKTAKQTKSSRSLQEVVGPEVYGAWLSMLRVLVPDGRTYRLAPLLAAMLQYACSVTEDKQDDDADEESINQSLMDSAETSDPDEVKDLLHDAVAQLFKDAGVKYGRVSARGQEYSIADDAYSDYVSWFDMPWE